MNKVLHTPGTRISKKQRQFLEAVEAANHPAVIEIFDEPRSLPYYVGHDFAWNWDFFSEGEARRWVLNLENRGLITIEKRHFARITDAGRAAIAAQEGGAA